MAFGTERETSVFMRDREFSIDRSLREYMLKIYNYMTIGLLITAGVSYYLAHSPYFSLFFNQAKGLTGLGWIVLLSPLLLVFMIYPAVQSLNTGVAFGLFVLYSALTGISLSPVCVVYTGSSVARVFLITSAMFLSTSLYGYTTRRDLTGWGSALMMALIGLIIASIVNIFLKSTRMDFLLSIVGVVIFSGLTAWDTQKFRALFNEADDARVMTGKAILGALELYLDFINLFLYLLRFFGSRRD